MTEKDSGRTVELQAGNTLEVVLSGKPTTGYGWEVASGDEAVIKQVGEPEYKADTARIGSDGKTTFHFKASAPGRTELKLVYRRPWEKNVPPEKTFEATVAVR
ncbi:MAG: protease inhibitor I42 family protein [Bacillota bacterium]